VTSTRLGKFDPAIARLSLADAYREYSSALATLPSTPALVAGMHRLLLTTIYLAHQRPFLPENREVKFVEATIRALLTYHLIGVPLPARAALYCEFALFLFDCNNYNDAGDFFLLGLELNPNYQDGIENYLRLLKALPTDSAIIEGFTQRLDHLRRPVFSALPSTSSPI
jgi:hypothetical protein